MTESMGRLFALVGMAAVLLAGMCDRASADLWRGDSYDFVDVIDTWTLDGRPTGAFDSALIVQGCPLVYQHDITRYGVPDQYQVEEAWLELDFTNDLSDMSGSVFCGLIRWDFREYARVAFDGESWVSIGEVDDGYYPLVLDIDWLNDDGILDVTVKVSNPLGTATAWLDHSVLYGNMAHVPVPGAALLGVLGLGYASMKLRRHAQE